MPNSFLPRPLSPLLASLLALVAIACGSNKSPDPDDDVVPGQTDFTSIENGSSGRAIPPTGGIGTATGAGGNGAVDSAAPGPTAGAPSGRVADVQEADIYKLVGTRLYYFNTYRGFIVYDVADPAKPVLVSRLPVYGYPVEMFVEGNVVYALLRDALYLTQVKGQVQFQRHNVSQLVTIDVGDVAHPRVLKTLDIVGQLHEGVSRKIDSTIYVVSEQWQGYSWGWPGYDENTEAQAWVYSYDVSNPTEPRQVGQLQIFQGNGSETLDANGNTLTQRWFQGVAISATANALMVVENWYSYDARVCNSAGQNAVVSVIDVSDPTGVIRRHTRFETDGAIDDQFKMTYRYDEAAGRGTFFGVFAEQSWSCGNGSITENRLESWDITDGNNPRRLAALTFGKAGETVRGTAYDLSRNVLYAITARQIDPLYAIDIADPAAPRIVSQIDGLSGSVSVFRTVGGGQFLLGVGQDQSASCNGQQDGDPSWLNTKMAVSIIDVRDLAHIRLAQRRCITIQGASGSWSNLTWNMDQAHKMLGMFQDGDLNLLTVPVSYYTQETLQVGWWYHWQTAVGILTWDLSRYDATKPPEQQTIVRSYGTFVHPQGEVMRSILFRHPSSGRTMINVSDTHLSLANLDDLAQPRLQSVVEVAPSVNEVYAFGDYVVERIDQGGYWSPTGVAQFRVKRAGGPIDEKAALATFEIGQAARVQRFKQSLVVLRYLTDSTTSGGTAPTTEAVVFDLADPTHPRLASRLIVPFNAYRYYGFYCGVGFWGGYWFGGGQQTLATDSGIVEVRTDYRYDGAQYSATPTISLLDLRDLNNPRVVETKLPAQDNNGWNWFTAIDDPDAPSGFYLARRDYLGEVKMGDGTFSRYKYFAQRYETGRGKLEAGASVNLPGPLAKTWVDTAGARRFLTTDFGYRTVEHPDRTEWHADTRLNLLKQVTQGAELTDTHRFEDVNLSSFIVDRDRLFVAAQNFYVSPDPRVFNPPTWESTSDRLMIFDLAAGKLSTLYDRPTRTYGVQLMGMNQGRLFVSLPGDGVLLTNVSDPANPRAVRFLRTLGWNAYIEPTGNDAYIAAGSFGVFDLDLTLPADIPVL